MDGTLKVIVVALGSAGDVHPQMGLALALQQRGHRVAFVGPVIFRALAERVGLEFIGVGREEDYYRAIRDPDLWNPLRAFRSVAKYLLIPALRPLYELIAARLHEGSNLPAQERDRIVVAAPATAFGARIAQEQLGVPLATVHLQPSLLRSFADPACYGFPDILRSLPPILRRLYYRAADRWVIDPPIAKEVNAFRAELGLAPVRRFFDRWLHSPELVIGLFPEWFAPAPPDWPPNVHAVGFPLWDEGEVRQPSRELEAFLAAGEPPVVFTAGSAMAQGREFFGVSAEVCRRSGRRGLLLTQFPEQLPARLPDGVCHFHYIPFSEVLPQAAAFVHHGGIGTTAQALAAGVPQLVVPLAHDQPDNAARVRRLGTGDYLLPKNYKPEKVQTRLEQLLASRAIHDSCRERANALVERTALARACDLIERLAASTKCENCTV
jgi:rhamnosyltransferase subunit B